MKEIPRMSKRVFPALWCGSVVAALLLAGVGCARSRQAAAAAPEVRAGQAFAGGVFGSPPGAPIEPVRWTLAMQAYTFRSFTLMQAAEKSAALGITAIEMYPGQTIGGDIPGAVAHTLDAVTRQRLADGLKVRGVRPVAYGVVNGKDEAEWRVIFEFAKALELSVITCEPAADQLDLVAGLCDQYAIQAAFHNHPQPSAYWSPETVLNACKGRSARLGACVDNGHWVRSGVNVMAGVRAMEGRLHAMHLKDVSSPSLSGECVALGAGFASAPEVIAELRRQRFAGVVSFEYESTPENPVPALEASLWFYRQCLALPQEALLTGRALPPGMSWDPADTWKQMAPGSTGQWPDPKPDESAGYRDTTDTAGGVVTASGEGFPNEQFPNAFDNATTKWCLKAATAWIQYSYPGERRERLAAYSLTTANDAPERDPRDWCLSGSNDGGKTWAEVDRRSDEKWADRHFKRLFVVHAPGEYTLYRLEITRNHGADTCQLSEIELLVPAAADPILTPAYLEALLGQADAAGGYQPLFASDLSDATFAKDSWGWENGELVAKGGGDIWTKATYGDLALDLEFRCEAETNSGVFLRCASIEDWLNTAIEVQILQPDLPERKHVCGAIFDCLAPVTNAVRPAGEWNRLTMLAKGNRILVRLNGLIVTDMDLSQWPQAGLNPDGSPNKFKIAYGQMARSGFVGLQYHGQPVRFRNLRLKSL
jgi:sugar phosphate isomerase/epimerase